MSAKQEAIRVLGSLPDDATWAQTIERLHIAAALEQAEAEIDAGRFFTQEQAEAHIEECLRKLSGPSAA